jgi:hypothetical protein
MVETFPPRADASSTMKLRRDVVPRRDLTPQQGQKRRSAQLSA